jgi:hypothetical protein
MPSPTNLFDDGGDVGHDDEFDSNESDEARRPNYWIRRGIVIGGVVAVFATAAIVIAGAIGSNGNDTATGTVSADWNRIVLVDERTGRVIVDDQSGDEVARIDTRTRSVVDSGVVDSTAVVVSATAAQVVDLDTETSTEFTLDADAITWPSGSGLTMIVASTGGDRGIVVSGSSGDVIDTDEFAPIAGARYEWGDARSDPTGREVLVTDSGNFQSVLFSFERDEPSYFPGLALAVDASTVVTTQNVGSKATVNLFDHDGEPISSGSTSSVRAALIGDGSVQLVTVDGEIVTMSTSSGDTKSTGQLEIGAIEHGIVTTTGDRLVVSGADGSAIIDASGSVVETFPDRELLVASWAGRGSTCVALSDGATASREQVAIVAFADGSVVNEADMTAPFYASADGCTIASSTSTGYQMTGVESVAAVTSTGDLVGLSPDAAQVVLELDGRLALTSTSAGIDDEPVDLGPTGRRVAFTQQ